MLQRRLLVYFVFNNLVVLYISVHQLDNKASDITDARCDHEDTQNTCYRLHLHFSNGYANEPQSYTSTLPALFELLPRNAQILHSCGPPGDVIPNKFLVFLISNFRRVLNIVDFL